MFVAEAVYIFAIMIGSKRVISVRYSSLVCLISVGGVLDLSSNYN